MSHEQVHTYDPTPFPSGPTNWDFQVDGQAEVGSRFDRLFAPILPAEETSTVDSYDHLVDPNYDLGTDIEKAARGRGIHRDTVTEASLKYAKESTAEAVKADPKLSEVLSKTGVSGDELSKKLRSDADLRKEVGLYLFGKASSMINELPERVRYAGGSGEKRPSLTGYDFRKDGKLTSLEYSTLLALAMLDGTFKPEQEKSVDAAPNGAIEDGQHRMAARQILFTAGR